MESLWPEILAGEILELSMRILGFGWMGLGHWLGGVPGLWGGVRDGCGVGNLWGVKEVLDWE